MSPIPQRDHFARDRPKVGRHGFPDLGFTPNNFSRSHSFTFCSLPTASDLSSGETASGIEPLRSVSVSRSWPIATSQMFRMPYHPASSTALFSGVKGRVKKRLRLNNFLSSIQGGWPLRVGLSFPLAASHNFTVPSQLPEASVLLSGENARQ